VSYIVSVIVGANKNHCFDQAFGSPW